MDTLFNKALVFGDPHFGRSSNSPIANKDTLDFLQWAIDEAKTWGAETCIMLGDWHDNRHSLHVSTILASVQGIDMLNAAFEKIWWLPGNHDLLYRDQRSAASIEFVKYLPNIHIIRDPLVIEDVTFLPWLLQDEYKSTKPTTKYVFAHLEFPGFYLNSKIEMQESDHTLVAKQFRECGDVYTGHFHMRQSKGNITYIGSTMPSSFSDDGDTDRGLMLLEHGREPVFKAWPEQPTYKTMTLSEMLAEPDKLLREHMTVRASIDLPLRYEEAGEIRSTLINHYGLRKIELINGHIKGNEEQTFDAKVQFRSVDSIVLEGLAAVESAELSTSVLTDMYNSLSA